MIVLLFDGVCNLCNGAVNWVIDRDIKNIIHFAAMQSDFGQERLAKLGMQHLPMNSLILDDNGTIYTKSNAAFRIATLLGGVWQFTVVLKIFPLFIRDAMYDQVAVNRYKWFGKAEQCRVPKPELKAKFLS